MRPGPAFSRSTPRSPPRLSGTPVGFARSARTETKPGVDPGLRASSGWHWRPPVPLVVAGGANAHHEVSSGKPAEIDRASLAVVLSRPYDLPAGRAGGTGGAGFGRAGKGCCRPREGRHSHPGARNTTRGATPLSVRSVLRSPGLEESGDPPEGRH